MPARRPTCSACGVSCVVPSVRLDSPPRPLRLPLLLLRLVLPQHPAPVLVRVLMLMLGLVLRLGQEREPQPQPQQVPQQVPVQVPVPVPRVCAPVETLRLWRLRAVVCRRPMKCFLHCWVLQSTMR